MSKTMAEQVRENAVARGFKVQDAPAPAFAKPGAGAAFEHQPIAVPLELEAPAIVPPPVQAEAEPGSDPDADEHKAKPAPDPISWGARLPAPDSNRRPPAFFPPQAIPSGLRFPKGLDVIFIRVDADLTAAKHKGDRYLVCWELSDGDDTFAYDRAGGNVHRAVRERVKQMIRAVDGYAVTWGGGGPADVDILWHDLGAKGRDLLHRLFNKLHVLTEEETASFFDSSIGLVRMA